MAAIAMASCGIVTADAGGLKTVFHGKIDSGWQLTDSAGQTAVSLYPDTSWYFRALVENSDGSFGVETRVGRSDLSPSMSPNLQGESLWGNLPGGVISLQGGLLYDTSWETDYEGWGSFEGVTGFELQAKPVKHLRLGFFVPVPSLSDPNATLAQTLQGTGYAISYSPDWGSFVAGLILSPQPSSNYAWYGIDITGNSNVTLQLEGQFTDIASASSGELDQVQVLGYQITKPFWAGVYLYEYYYGTPGSAIGFDAAPTLTYKVGIAKLQMEFDYFLSSGQGVAPAIPGIAFKPSVDFVFNSYADLQITPQYKIGNLQDPQAGKFILTAEYCWEF